MSWVSGRFFSRILAISVLPVCLLLPVSASALSVTSQIITIKATVLPMHCIVVNADGTIESIISNNLLTDSPTAVYYNSVNQPNQTVMTSAIKQHYQAIMKNTKPAYGVIYTQPQPSELATKQNPLTIISIARFW